MTPPRLSILHTEASLGWGGQEIRILTEARGVARRGHAVAIAAPPDSRILPAAAGYGVEAIALPVGRKDLRGLAAVRGLLRSRRFDVVNTHSSTDSWLAAVARVGLEHAPPLVRTRHISASIPSNPASRWLYRRATRRIVTTGERLREQVIRETGVSPSRVVSIATGIDLARYRRGDRRAARAALGLPVEGFIVGIVATMRGWKGHSFLFEALAAMPERSARLVAVGDGPQREVLGALAASLGIADRVVFPGNQDDVVPWLQAMDLFCLPSWANEGVPQGLMQAMACGIPVISTPVGSIDEIVRDGHTGVLVPPRDAAALRAAIERLRNDEALRARLAEAGHREAQARFGEALMVDRMLEVFTAAAASGA
jgi:glycosyltransferase involved in cell wall biosynthesis